LASEMLRVTMNADVFGYSQSCYYVCSINANWL